jgi:hypothetical protein
VSDGAELAIVLLVVASFIAISRASARAALRTSIFGTPGRHFGRTLGDAGDVTRD